MSGSLEQSDINRHSARRPRKRHASTPIRITDGFDFSFMLSFDANSMTTSVKASKGLMSFFVRLLAALMSVSHGMASSLRKCLNSG